MRKLTCLFSMTGASLIFLFLLLSSFGATVHAQSKFEVNNSSEQLSVFSDKLEFSRNFSYTAYLPFVRTPPPPNPKKGFGARGRGCSDLKVFDASWYLNWLTRPDSTCAADKGFVPRLSRSSDMARLSQAIDNAKASGWLIGFTEPNLPWQGNISPSQAAIYWRQIEQEANGIKLVSPSPSQHDPQWLWRMIDAYKGLYGTKPRFDAIGWNIYKRKPSEVQSYLIDRHNEALSRGYNVPIWVLEYGGECWNTGNGNTGNNAIMTSVTPWLDATPWIGRYAWFANRITGSETSLSWRSCSLIDTSNGQLTDLGNVYREF